MTVQEFDFRGTRILIIDTEAIVRTRLAHHLRSLSAIVDLAGSGAEAAKSIEAEPFACVVLEPYLLQPGDIRLFCHRLVELNLPFLFHTHVTPSRLAQSWPGAPIVCKPHGEREIAASIARIVDAPRSRQPAGSPLPL